MEHITFREPQDELASCCHLEFYIYLFSQKFCPKQDTKEGRSAGTASVPGVIEVRGLAQRPNG